MSNLPLPTLIAHADWSAGEAKRWMAKAVLGMDGRYRVCSPEKVIDPGGLLERLREEAGVTGTVLAGFDFPIGLPLAYAERAGIRSFFSFLVELGRGEWPSFDQVAEQPGQICIERPFYPARPGSARLRHLFEGLGLDHAAQLRRQCESSRPGRRAAAPLFWTIGGQQVGKAALSGWRAVLLPAVGDSDFSPHLKIWPFDGLLAELLRPGQVVVTETYPAECYTHLGITFSPPRRGQKSGKRAQPDRITAGGKLLAWAANHPVTMEEGLAGLLRSGFGPRPDGEDAFDATVGLIGMLNVLLGDQPVGEPPDERVRVIEGWIFGQVQ